ncbi:MAG: hypothetical protein Q9227_002116 [Pyrenula ochraceoflavens]
MAQSDQVLDKLIQRHPLQRLKSPSRGFSALVHVAGLASFTNQFLLNTSYGWHFQYLTILGLTLTTLTFILGLSSDLLLSSPLFRAKTILTVISAPLSTLISLLYWSLSLLDRSLVVPPDPAFQLPLPTDLGFHLFPTLFLLIDILLLSPPWTISALPSLGLAGVIAFGYWWWIELCYSRNGFYPYPLFGMLDTTQRVGLFSLSAVLMSASTMLLRWGYGRVNGRERPGMVKG